MKQYDFSDKKCPYPVVETRKLLLNKPQGQFVVKVGDDIAKDNVTKLSTGFGYLVESSEVDGGFLLTIEKGGESTIAAVPSKGDTVIFIASDKMGEGNDELGHILLKNFIYTLKEATTLPTAILFVNGGVTLSCDGSDVAEALNELACAGVDVASCGLCLEYYDLKEKVTAGRVTNMLEIIEIQNCAGRIIRP